MEMIMKFCKRCQLDKPIIEFDSTTNRSKDKLFSWCRSCRKIYDKERYDRIGSKTWLIIRRNVRKERKNWFVEYKSKLKCSMCPENHPSTLDFHHKDPKSKLDCISNLVAKGIKEETILEEILKCDVLCANCHRKLHIKYS